MRYPDLLACVHRSIAGRFGLETSGELDEAFGASVPLWPAFPDSAEALRILKRHYRLVILSNVHRDGFAASNGKLGVEFDAIHTAEAIGSYKPADANFAYLLAHLRSDFGINVPRPWAGESLWDSQRLDRSATAVGGRELGRHRAGRHHAGGRLRVLLDGGDGRGRVTRLTGDRAGATLRRAHPGGKMRLLTERQRSQYRDDGFVVVPRLFEPDTARQMIAHYMAARRRGPLPGDFGGTSDHPDDPTHRYPRMHNMHDWDPLSGQWATAPQLQSVVQQLIDDAPVLRQTMIYFKPPGGRGQGLHQDAQYITIEPLIGVWVALDKSDDRVGPMTVVRGSHKRGLMPVQAADTSVSFTDVQSVVPEDAEIIEVTMEPGDALFFDGKTIHGSYQNRTDDRWRRSFICHYIGRHAEKFEPEQGKHVSHLRRA